MTRSTVHLARRRGGFALLSGLATAGVLAGCVGVSADPAPEDGVADGAGQSGSGADGAGDAEYADGTYSADGDYQSPNGTETVTVTVSIADGIVTEVDVDGHATSGNPAQYQGQFADGIAAEVVGVALEDVEVSRVAGSSLTSGGFNAAIDAIQEQART